MTKILSSTALAMLLSTGVALAQATGTPTTSDVDTTNVDTNAVGTPNTGSGGDTAANMALLAGSAAVAIAGGALLMRRRYL